MGWGNVLVRPRMANFSVNGLFTLMKIESGACVVCRAWAWAQTIITSIRPDTRAPRINWRIRAVRDIDVAILIDFTK